MPQLRSSLRIIFCALGMVVALAARAAALADPLPSWNEGAAKTAIVAFVGRVATEGSPDFVPVPERVAVFDNDGTLWPEQPVPAQVAFELACLAAQEPGHPAWSTTQPFKAALEKDTSFLARIGEKGFENILVASHAGWTTHDYDTAVKSWMATTRDARFNLPITKLVYQPMLELIGYMRSHGFDIYILSGNTADFMRPWVASVYGIPPDHVIGSSIRTKFEMIAGKPSLTRLPEMSVVGDGAGRPAGIYERIGRRPIAVFGNSDGDLEMLQWATSGTGARLGAIVHHTDAEREYRYDRDAEFGRLDKALNLAAANGWTTVDMKRDWKIVFPFELR